MKSSDRTILVGLIVVGAFAAFWFLALSPKKAEVSDLEGKVAQLETDVSAQEQLVVAGQAAQKGYQKNYSSLVVLGKAAPTDGDTPSLLNELISISNKAKADFSLLQLGTAPDEAETAAAETTTDQAEASEAEAAAATSTTAPLVPTEASAASLPIGAAVGSAGLGRLVYDMRFFGDFFQIADLFAGVDALVASKGLGVDVGGRLITINGFNMTKLDEGPLEVDLSISSYVLPESQGLTAGATSTMPPESVPAATPVAEPAP